MIRHALQLTACLFLTQLLIAQEPADLDNITKIRTGIRSKRVSSADSTGGNNDRLENIAPGKRQKIFDVGGAGVINHIWITIAPGPDIVKRDDIVLRMYWDGQSAPSVAAPLGSFFGQGWNEAYPFHSQPLYAVPGGSKALVCYFKMPFAKGAVIEIENQGKDTIGAFYYYVDYYAVDKLPADQGRFHASYRRELTKTSATTRENEWDVLGPSGNNKTGAANYLVADIKGRGQFVGLNYYVHSPTPMWYGEGDDMIIIDGDAGHVLKGTGTEDYFNTSWSPKTAFLTPQFGAARVNTSDEAYLSNGWLGRTHVYRFHLSDPIYFDRSLRFTIEHGHNNSLVLDLRTVAYWYQSVAAAVPEVPPLAQRGFMPLISPVDIHKWRDAWRRAKGDKDDLWGND